MKQTTAKKIVKVLLLITIIALMITSIELDKQLQIELNKEPIVVTEIVYQTTSEFDIDKLIEHYSNIYGMDQNLIKALALHETGNYTSKAFKNNNVCGNFGGGASLLTFDTLEEGVIYCINNLKYNKAYKSIEWDKDIIDIIFQLQPIYAPEGVENDPQGLNKNWTQGVIKHYLKESER